MKLLSGCLSFILVVTLIICVVSWLFISDFILFDILFAILAFGIQIIIAVAVIVGIIWFIKEIFG